MTDPVPNKVGRPLRYTSVDLLEAAIHAFFVTVDDGDKIPTISGLANALDVDRATLHDYAGRSDEYSTAIKRALGLIEAFWEKKLAGTACTGAIFWLKNRGWKDERSHDVTSKGEKIEGITYLPPAPVVTLAYNGPSDKTYDEAAPGLPGSQAA